MPVEVLDHQLKKYYTVAVDVAKKAGEVKVTVIQTSARFSFFDHINDNDSLIRIYSLTD